MNWIRVPVRRLFRVVNGGTPVADPKNWDGPIAWATPVDLARANGTLLDRTDRHITEDGLRSGSRAVPPAALIVPFGHRSGM